MAILWEILGSQETPSMRDRILAIHLLVHARLDDDDSESLDGWLRLQLAMRSAAQRLV